ncbi:MAG TPA: MOSC domain-containing protein [Xanthobacteraceae bacterium]|jgi:hypothetical protein|nr:MOSC domain-containing protein [Xanthobacteraceae bacterium]
MSNPKAKIRDIYRYPVKGLTPERLGKTVLGVGETLRGDRRFAIENGPSGFEPATPSYLPKTHFLMLMRNERLARLNATFDDASHILSIKVDGRQIRGDLSTPKGREVIEKFFAAYCADELRGPPRILEASGHSFSDVSRKVVSIINLASVAELETIIGTPVDPLRFRANVYVEGWRAWHEFDLLGSEIAVGSDVRLNVVKRIKRCAATDVDPQTGIRDLSIPHALMKDFKHPDCGIYAEVISAGSIAVGDTIG